MLPNTCKRESTKGKMLNKIEDRDSKLTHGQYMSSEQPLTCEDCGENTSLTVKHIPTENPSLNNRRRQFYSSTSKTMEQLLNDGDTSYGDTLYKFVTNIDLLTKL